jgi:hypothetical protein
MAMKTDWFSLMMASLSLLVGLFFLSIEGDSTDLKYIFAAPFITIPCVLLADDAWGLIKRIWKAF